MFRDGESAGCRAARAARAMQGALTDAPGCRRRASQPAIRPR